MKLIHIVPHISEEASGPSYSVPRLCESLAARGNQVTLSCLAAKEEMNGVRLELHRQWPILPRFAISTSHARELRRNANRVDIIHNHSLWSMVNVAAGWVVPGRMAKLVTSPRGTLSQWALSRSKSSKMALWPLQRRALTHADLLHATSDSEYNEIRALGLRAPVAIIPNGIDLPIQVYKTPNPVPRTLLFLSRLHPKKGIDRLLQAWHGLQRAHPDWQLVVVGRGELAHEHEVRKMAEALELQRVHFPGPLYGEEKSRMYYNSDLFVLPTHSENFGMVVAEALAHGCPALVSRGAPWPGLEREGCGWWVEHDVLSLTEALDAAMALPPRQLVAMGIKGRDWMQREFGWDSVAERMEAAYHWLVAGGEPPACVRVD